MNARGVVTSSVAHQEMSVLAAIHQRRAVRAYRDTRVDEQTVRLLLDAAVHAPTAMHEEPWAFVVVQDRAILARYSDRAKQMLRDEAIVHPRRSLELIDRPEFNIFYDAGTLIVICGRPMGPYVVADCWLAAENLMLAACAMGLGSCPIGFAVPVLNTPEVKSELGIPPEVTVIAPIIVGVPSAQVPLVARKPPEVLSWK